MASQSSSHKIGWALVAPIIIGALFGLCAGLLERRDVPTADDYDKLRVFLAAHVGPDDAVAVLPAWSMRAQMAARAHTVISGDNLAGYPFDRFAKVFVVVEPDGELDAIDYAVAAKTKVGRLRVYTFQPGRAVRTDFTARIHDAEVSVDDKRCSISHPRGIRCGGKDWQRVTRDFLDVSENGDTALWAHPPGQGKTLVVVYRDVPLGNVLVVRAGHTRLGARSGRTAVNIDIDVDGRRIGTITRWPAFDFTTTEIATQRSAHATVRFSIHTADNKANHFAFDALSLDRQRP